MFVDCIKNSEKRYDDTSWIKPKKAPAYSWWALRGATPIYYTYDAAGLPTTMTVGSTTYYYVYNLQGDIIAITNGGGFKVVEYTYDPWGKLISTTGSMASSIGVQNPYRYRAYRYDTELEMYYLNSRYYDPEIGRFINADAISLLGADGSLLSFNLFSYCFNEPIDHDDDNGTWPRKNRNKHINDGQRGNFGGAFTKASPVFKPSLWSRVTNWIESQKVKIADKKLNNIINNPNSINQYSTTEFENIAKQSSWQSGSAKNGKGFRATKGNYAIRYNMNGTRFDADHYYGNPYWVVSSAISGAEKVEMK